MCKRAVLINRLTAIIVGCARDTSTSQTYACVNGETKDAHFVSSKITSCLCSSFFFPAEQIRVGPMRNLTNGEYNRGSQTFHTSVLPRGIYHENPMLLPCFSSQSLFQKVKTDFFAHL